MAYALASQTLSGNSATAAVTLTHTPVQGNGGFICIAYQAVGALTIASIKNQAATNIPFTEASSSAYNLGAAAGFGQRLVWIPDLSLSGATTAITVTMSSAAEALYFALAEYSGLTTSLTIDAQHAFETTSAAGGGNDVTSGTATPGSSFNVNSGAIVFGFQGSYSAFESCTAGAGFGNYLALNPIPGVDGAGAIEDKRITTNAAFAAIFSSATTGNDYYTQMLIVDEPFVAPPPPPTPAAGPMPRRRFILP